jgi:hypothetical protein
MSKKSVTREEVLIQSLRMLFVKFLSVPKEHLEEDDPVLEWFDDNYELLKTIAMLLDDIADEDEPEEVVVRKPSSNISKVRHKFDSQFYCPNNVGTPEKYNPCGLVFGHRYTNIPCRDAGAMLLSFSRKTD